MPRPKKQEYTYESSLIKGPGYTLATLEEALEATEQAIGMTQGLYAKDAKEITDNATSYTSLSLDYLPKLQSWLTDKLKVPAIIAGTVWALEHAEGTIVYQIVPGLAKLQYLSAKNTGAPKLFVKGTLVAPLPTATLSPAFLAAMKGILTPAQIALLLGS